MTAFLYDLLRVASVTFFTLQPTNTATSVRNVSFALAAIAALALALAALADRWERPPSPGRAILATLAAWSLWSCASLLWSVDPEYTANELRREVGWSLATMLMFYVVVIDGVAWRRLVVVILAGFAVFASSAIGITLSAHGWHAGGWHVGVGAFSTYLVLVAPLLLLLLAPEPAGLGGGRIGAGLAVLLLLLLLAAARLADNRMVWIALAATFATISALAALRWHAALRRAPLRWLAPLAALLVVLGLLFAQTARDKASVNFPPHTSVAQTFAHDPRLQLWDHTLTLIGERPWTGYGFGKSILATELRQELRDPELSHAHNVFMSQWLQTGVVGLAAFAALLAALLARYARFVRSADDPLAFIGIVGIALVAGFLVKNLTDDFLIRLNGKEFWALNAALLAYGVRRERASAAPA